MNRPDNKPENALPHDICAEDIQAVCGIPADPAERFGMMGIVPNECVQSPYPAADPRLDDMGAWNCKCGNLSSGNFCTECGEILLASLCPQCGISIREVTK